MLFSQSNKSALNRFLITFGLKESPPSLLDSEGNEDENEGGDSGGSSTAGVTTTSTNEDEDAAINTMPTPAESLGLPSEIVRQRGRQDGEFLIFPSQSIHDAILRLEKEFLIPTITSVRTMVAYRDQFYRYVYTQALAHQACDDIEYIIENALKGNDEIVASMSALEIEKISNNVASKI